MKSFTLLVLVGLMLCACNGDEEEKCVFVPETATITLDLVMESLEDSLPSVTSKAQLVGFLSRHKVLREVIFNRMGYTSDSLYINELYQRFTSPYLDTLLMEVHRVFGDGKELRQQFENAYRNLKYYYPNARIPRIQTVVTGMESDVFVSDSLVIVGLDYFLGEGARYRPNLYDYILKRYTKDFIVPSVFLLTGIGKDFSKVDPADKTVLAEMISYGKAYYFTKRMMPCTPDSLLIGYTKKDVEDSEKFEYLIWSRLVEDQVIFSTNHLVKQKYISERPRTIEVGEQCPGRIGTWVGWQIVKKYMETHPDVTLSQLMQNSNASQIFTESKYKPPVVKLPSREKV